MNLETSAAIGKIAKAGGETGQVTGYIHAEKKDAKSFRLYPELSAGQYFEIDTGDVIDVVDAARGDERKTVLLKSDARVNLVTLTELSGRDLSAGGNGGWVSYLKKQDRLRIYLMLANKAFLEMYLGTESIPGTGQSGSPADNL